MPFGKYRGRCMTELPLDYLHWLQALPDLRAPLRAAVADELRARQDTWHDAPPRATPPPPPRGYRPEPDICRALIDAGLRALAKQHHPDAGGSHAAMIRVTAAADWLQTCARSLAA